ncbi:MAG TPA: GTPase HflX, partial [Acidimicrobiia bacterium]|nr:GTPase HflX [Acidimicrobiia bacterium]
MSTANRPGGQGHAGRQRRRLTATEVDLGVVRQRALLVGGGDVGLEEAESSLAELALLTDTAGADPVALEMQRRETPDPATFIGKGKAEELRELGEMLDIDVVIFDEELSPAQQRNLEKLFKVDVVDRVALILDIFAQHAHSQAGMLQVELAQLRYRLPRLRGRGVEMSQQGAGIGTRGPGETQLEVDRRRILRRIAKLERDLAGVARVRDTQRKARRRNDYPLVALVGYTNAGKSTLLNRLTGAGVL